MLQQTDIRHIFITSLH